MESYNSYKASLFELLLAEELKSEQNSLLASTLRLHMEMETAYIEYFRTITSTTLIDVHSSDSSSDDHSYSNHQIRINCFQGIDLHYSSSGTSKVNGQIDDDQQQHWHRTGPSL